MQWGGNRVAHTFQINAQAPTQLVLFPQGDVVNGTQLMGSAYAFVVYLNILILNPK